MLSILHQPYPLTIGWHTTVRSGLMAGGVVAAVLYLFRPFGTNVSPDYEWFYILICLMFGAVTFVCSLVWGSLKKLTPYIYDEKRWTVGKSILDTLGLIFLIGIGNWLAAELLSGRTPNLRTLWAWEWRTLVVAIAPVTMGFLLSYMRLLKKHNELARAAGLSLAERPREEDKLTVVLQGDNKEDQLTLQPKELLAITSADNYVEVWHIVNGQTQRTMLRSTLKKMESQLEGHQQFMRSHRTSIANLDLVNEVSGNAQGLRLHIEGLPEPLPVSRQLSGDERLLGMRG